MKNKISHERLLSEVIKFRGVTLEEIKTSSRKTHIIHTKHLFRYACLDMAIYLDCHKTQTEIGKMATGTHGTVINGQKRYQNWLDTDKNIRNEYGVFKKRVIDDYGLLINVNNNLMLKKEVFGIEATEEDINTFVRQSCIFPCNIQSISHDQRFIILWYWK